MAVALLGVHDWLSVVHMEFHRTSSTEENGVVVVTLETDSQNRQRNIDDSSLKRYTNRPGHAPGQLADILLAIRASAQIITRLGETIRSRPSHLSAELRHLAHRESVIIFNSLSEYMHLVGGSEQAKKKRIRSLNNQRCTYCRKTSGQISQWRRGPDKYQSLCNGCGLHYKLNVRKEFESKSTYRQRNLRLESLLNPPSKEYSFHQFSFKRPASWPRPPTHRSDAYPFHNLTPAQPPPLPACIREGEPNYHPSFVVYSDDES